MITNTIYYTILGVPYRSLIVTLTLMDPLYRDPILIIKAPKAEQGTRMKVHAGT